MTDSFQTLSRLNRTLQLSRVWLRSALHAASGPELIAQLRHFSRELEYLETDVRHTVCQRGWEPESLSPALSYWHSRRFRRRNSDAFIAEQLILLCTKNRVQLLRQVCRDVPDCAAALLAQQTTDTYAVMLRQLERFL